MGAGGREAAAMGLQGGDADLIELYQEQERGGQYLLQDSFHFAETLVSTVAISSRMTE